VNPLNTCYKCEVKFPHPFHDDGTINCLDVAAWWAEHGDDNEEDDEA
jgi:hypothetical protein